MISNRKNLKKIYDVVFIGTMSKANRKEIVDFLKNNNIKVEDFGLGSNNGILNSKQYFDTI